MNSVIVRACLLPFLFLWVEEFSGFHEVSFKMQNPTVMMKTRMT
jgi:hypothetical protein